MERIHLLAAEIFRYSYVNYEEHLGSDHRFDKSMPKDAAILEEAVKEKWPVEKVAEKLDISDETASEVLHATFEAIEIVNAESPIDSFRKAVEHTLRYALTIGVKDDKDLMRLVDQISYRAADLSYLLEMEDKKLADYSKSLTETPLCDEVSDDL